MKDISFELWNIENISNLLEDKCFTTNVRYSKGEEEYRSITFDISIYRTNNEAKVKYTPMIIALEKKEGDNKAGQIMDIVSFRKYLKAEAESQGYIIRSMIRDAIVDSDAEEKNILFKSLREDKLLKQIILNKREIRCLVVLFKNIIKTKGK